MHPDAEAGPGRPNPDVSLSVAEIRDYAQINAYLVQALDRGARVVRLTGVDGQRLLAFRLTGSWNAVIEVEGRAGPELAAEMNAPALTVMALQGAADAAGRGLVDGRLVLLGPATDALGYHMIGGTILALAGAGARAGLRQHGGLLAIAGPLGRLAADRQGGGMLWVLGETPGPLAGRARRGGRLIGSGFESPAEPDKLLLKNAAEGLRPWLECAELGSGESLIPR